MSDDSDGFGFFVRERHRMTLPGILDSESSADLRKIVLEDDQITDILDLDASQVLRIGTPGVQFILAVGHHLGATRRGLEISQPSETFVSAFRDLGLGAELAQWSGT